MVINSIVFATLSNYFFGAWWAGLVTFLSGLLGVLSLRRGVVVAACVLAIISVLVCLSGMIVDSVGSNLMNSIETCASTNNEFAAYAYNYYGNSAYESSCFTCIELYFQSDSDCYCVDSQSNCYFFNGQPDCNVIFTSYTKNLAVSVTFDTFCFVLVFVFSIITCFSICCPYGFRKKAPTFKNTLSANDREASVRNPLGLTQSSGKEDITSSSYGNSIAMRTLSNILRSSSANSSVKASSKQSPDDDDDDDDDLESRASSASQTRKIRFSERVIASIEAFKNPTREGTEVSRQSTSAPNRETFTSERFSTISQTVSSQSMSTQTDDTDQVFKTIRPNRRSSIERKRMPPSPPVPSPVSHSSSMSSNTSPNDSPQLETLSHPLPASSRPSLMKIFEHEDISGVSNDNLVESSFKENANTIDISTDAALGESLDSLDAEMVKELAEMKKELEIFEPSKSSSS